MSELAADRPAGMTHRWVQRGTPETAPIGAPVLEPPLVLITEGTSVSPTTTSVHGPVDFVLIEFPGDRLTGEVAPALVDLVERGVIRLYDLMVISKADDGSVEAMELKDPSGVGGFAYFAGARSGLLGNEDLQQAADAMAPGTVAALIVYENTWAVPFVTAALNSGGELIASARIPAPDIMAALEALETLEPTT